MAPSRISRAAFAVAASSLLVAAGTAPAFATDAYTIPLHQPVPITADSFGKPEPKCADIPATQDGWHFIAPGSPNEISFVKLTVTFEPGGQQVITSFGPPNDNHAYVASAPGAKLTSAVAEVKGGRLEWFNLSHTCPATATPSPSGSPSASVSASKTPAGTPSGTTSGAPSTTPSTSVSASRSVTPTRSASGTPSGTPSAAQSSPAPAPGGDLAKTGSDLPVALVSAVAVALVAAGGVLVMRRRRAQ
ncbi:LPXTG cell wall anchor domain-containing protein [Streptomyces sp. NPDC048255]|uniref:LPXTG cell wall anchor domain-containing protein n=1 Tax=Streptomyces sp. NPDC048255 TaxID=3154713 RepID=UPI0033FA2702